jgi:hypothetical protein
MVKSLFEIAPAAQVIFVPRDLAKRPAHAALIAQTISSWNYAEHALGRSLASMTQGGSAAVMAGYASTFRFAGRNSRVSTLVTEAESRLTEPFRGTYVAALFVIMKFAQRRHDFAHHIWGCTDDAPDVALLVDPDHLFGHWGAANDFIAGFAADPGTAPKLPVMDTSLIQAWTEADLAEELELMFRAHELSLALERMVVPDNFSSRAAQRQHVQQQLLAEPLISAAHAAGKRPRT